MQVLNFIASISRLGGGLAPAVLESVATQRQLGIEAQVATLLDAYTGEDGGKYGIPYMAESGVTPLRFSPRLKTQLMRQPPPDLVHDHGMWLYTNYLAFNVSERGRIPLVVSPHGMMAPWCWQHHRWKKLPIWWWWERRKVARAVVLVATSEMEAQHISNLALDTPIAIIPLGIHPPVFCEPKPEHDTRIALFLSRIHPVKGLDMLIQAVKQLQPPGWKFVIAGPDAGGYEAAIKTDVHNAGLDRFFAFPGALYEEEKWRYLREADLFILPSVTENFGIVVVEALTCETPVITTTGTPWKELQQHHCGWWVAPSVSGVTLAIAEAVNTPREPLRQMGVNGRRLVESSYTWRESAIRTVELYRWVLGETGRPAFVSEI